MNTVWKKNQSHTFVCVIANNNNQEKIKRNSILQQLLQSKLIHCIFMFSCTNNDGAIVLRKNQSLWTNVQTKVEFPVNNLK